MLTLFGTFKKWNKMEHLSDHQLKYLIKRVTLFRSEVNQRCSPCRGFNDKDLALTVVGFPYGKNEYHSVFTWTRYINQSERRTAAWENDGRERGGREGERWGSMIT